MMTSESINPLGYSHENHNWDDFSFVEQWLDQKANRVPEASNGTSSVGPVLREQKRFRTSFTTKQLRILENVYSETRFVNKPTCNYLALFLNINWKKVKVWFQNRRMRDKRYKTNKKYRINNKPTTNQPICCKTHYHYLLPVGKEETVTSQSVLTQENHEQQICSSSKSTTTNYRSYLSSLYQNNDLDSGRSPCSLNNVTGQSVLTQENFSRQRCSSNETTTTNYETFLLSSYQFTDLDTSGSPSSLKSVTGQSVLAQENYDQQIFSSNETNLTNYENSLLSSYQYTDLDTSGSSSTLNNVTGKSVLIQENFDQQRYSNNETTTTNYQTSVLNSYQYTDLDTSGSPSSFKSVTGQSGLAQQNYDQQIYSSNDTTTTDYENSLLSSYQYTDLDTSGSSSTLNDVTGKSVLIQENFDQQRYSSNETTTTNYETSLLNSYQYTDLDTSGRPSNLKIVTDQSSFTFQEQPVSNNLTPIYGQSYEQRHYNVSVPYKSEIFSDIEIDESSNSLESSDNFEVHSNKLIQHQCPVISTNKRDSQGDNVICKPRSSSEKREQTKSVEKLIEEIMKEYPYLTPQHESCTFFDTQSEPIEDYSVNLSFDEQYHDKATVSFATNVYGSEWMIKNEISYTT